MSNKVHNGPVGKLFRTLGFLLLFASGAILVLNHVNSFEFIENNITVVNNFVYGELSFLIEYTHLMLIVGLIFLIWTQTKNYFNKIFFTITTLVVYLVYYQIDVNVFPSFLRFDFLKISFLITKLNNINWLTYAILGANSLFLYLLFGFKKPRRISIQFVSSSMLLVLVGLTVYYLPELINKQWQITTLISSGVFSLAYLVMTLGSLFGVLGFARK